jgi:hypothetical protein
MLAVGHGGEMNPDPLVEWNFRFNRRGNRWMRISIYSKGSFRRGLPRVVSRSTVAEEVGVPEEAIAAWQVAFTSSGSSRNSSSLESRLAIGPDGPIDQKPLVDWSFEFFPQSGVWRRTRGQRSEVSRRAVASKVGVSEDLIRRWEEAMIASWRSTS